MLAGDEPTPAAAPASELASIGPPVIGDENETATEPDENETATEPDENETATERHQNETATERDRRTYTVEPLQVAPVISSDSTSTTKKESVPTPKLRSKNAGVAAKEEKVQSRKLTESQVLSELASIVCAGDPNEKYELVSKIGVG